MKFLRSILSVLSAPIVYGVICVPLVGVLSSLQPALLNEQGGTYDVTLTLKIELLQLVVILAAGAAVGALAPSRVLLHAAIATALMLAIGVTVQLSFWDAMLVWHHVVFFACILVGVPSGALLVQRLKGEDIKVSP